MASSVAMDCANCAFKIKPTPRNATLQTWAEQPWYTILILDCSWCKERTFIYTEGNARQLRKLEKKGIPTVIVGDFAPRKVVKWYRKHVGKPPLKSKSLTKEEKAEVAETRRKLEQGEAEAFLATQPNPKID
jgi:hypothetical protein